MGKTVNARNETNMTLRATLLRPIAAVLAFLVLLLGVPGVAAAHDAVTATSPKDGSIVTLMPETVSITMSSKPEAIGVEVQVLDPVGTNWADGAAQVNDHVVTQKVRAGAQAGTFTVKWRAVSSDSHPVEQEFTFTVSGAAAAGSAAPVAGAGPVVGISEMPQTVQPQIVHDESTIPWSIYGFIGVFFGLLVALVVIARRRLKAEHKQ